MVSHWPTVTLVRQWLKYQGFISKLLHKTFLPSVYPTACCLTSIHIDEELFNAAALSPSTWVSLKCGTGMNILEMSTAVLTGHRLIMLVENVILINSGTINFSFQIQNRKWLYNKRSLKLPPCILWYFNHLMFSLSSWTSFHFAHWSNYNFFFTWVLIPLPVFTI